MARSPIPPEVLAAQADRARINDLGVDAALVQHLESDLRIVGALVDHLKWPVEQGLIGIAFLPVAADDPGSTVRPDDLAVEYPRRTQLRHPRQMVRELRLLHLGHPVAIRHGCIPGEKIGRLAPVGVGVNNEREIARCPSGPPKALSAFLVISRALGPSAPRVSQTRYADIVAHKRHLYSADLGVARRGLSTEGTKRVGSSYHGST